MEITSIMDRVTGTTLSLEEYKGYQPFIEEIAHVATENIGNVSNGSQALAYIRFFIERGNLTHTTIEDLHKAVRQSLQNTSVENLLDIVEILKSNNIHQGVEGDIAQELKSKVGKATPDEVPYVTLVVADCNLHDQEFVSKVDKALNDKISIESFELMCRLALEHNLELENFIDNAREYAEAHLEEFSFIQLGNVLTAVSLFNGDFSLAQKSEKRILDHGRKLSVEDCVYLMPVFINYNSSEDLWTLFDMIIGRNVRKIDQSQILPILNNFASAPHKREKLFQLFVYKIKESELTTSDYCKLARIYDQVGYKKSDIYEVLDEKIAKNVRDLTEGDIIDAYIGFVNPNIKSKLKVQKYLEQYASEIFEQMSIDNASILMIKYGQLRKGSKKVINPLIDRVYAETIKTNPESYSAFTILSIVNGYHLLGVDVDRFYPVLDALAAKIPEYNYDLLNNLINVILEYKDDPKFSK